MSETLNLSNLVVGDTYRWKHGDRRPLTYLGHNWSGNGYWHQFATQDDPENVWCEILTSDLHWIEKSMETVEQ